MISEYYEFGTKGNHLKHFDAPEDPNWISTEMLIRHGVSITGKPGPGALVAALRLLDDYGERTGMRRHGELTFETWDWGHKSGLASRYKIVDIGKYTRFIEDNAREKERNEIRRWPWWRRLFWRPPE